MVKGQVARTTTTRDAARRSPRFKFVSDIIAELKKVVWLTRREAAYLTMLVLIVTIAAGLVLGGVDYAFAAFIDKVILPK